MSYYRIKKYSVTSQAFEQQPQSDNEAGERNKPYLRRGYRMPTRKSGEAVDCGEGDTGQAVESAVMG